MKAYKISSESDERCRRSCGDKISRTDGWKDGWKDGRNNAHTDGRESFLLPPSAYVGWQSSQSVKEYTFMESNFTISFSCLLNNRGQHWQQYCLGAFFAFKGRLTLEKLRFPWNKNEDSKIVPICTNCGKIWRYNHIGHISVSTFSDCLYGLSIKKE